jgi:hypothetical protein
MVYNTGLLVFLDFPSSGILETRKHDVSENGSVSLLPEDGNRSSFRKVVFSSL